MVVLLLLCWTWAVRLVEASAFQCLQKFCPFPVTSPLWFKSLSLPFKDQFPALKALLEDYGSWYLSLQHLHFCETRKSDSYLLLRVLFLFPIGFEGVLWGVFLVSLISQALSLRLIVPLIFFTHCSAECHKNVTTFNLFCYWSVIFLSAASLWFLCWNCCYIPSMFSWRKCHNTGSTSGEDHSCWNEQRVWGERLGPVTANLSDVLHICTLVFFLNMEKKIYI